jgi:hypothetical protein
VYGLVAEQAEIGPTRATDELDATDRYRGPFQDVDA